MNRRIIAALLSMIMMISIFPISAIAEGTKFYGPGDEPIWVSGVNTDPNEDPNYQTVDGYEWIPSRDKDNGRINKPGCGKDEHKHTQEQDCFDASGVICTIPPHTHGPVCSIFSALYQWEIAAKDITPTAPSEPVEPSEPSEPVKPSEPESGEDGFNEDPGQLSFVVQNINAAGVPLSGISFLMFDSNGDGLGNTLTTNNDGQVRFNALENYAGSSPLPWYLGQEGTAFDKDKGGKYFNQYYYSDITWEIDIDSENLISITPTKESVLEREETEYAEGFDGSVLTVINERVRCTLDVNVKFQGIQNEQGINVIPGGMTASVEVSGYESVLNFPVEKQNSDNTSPWQETLLVEPGTYAVTPAEPAVIEGYKYIGAICELQVKKLVEGTKDEYISVWEPHSEVTLGADNTLGIFRITYTYEKIEEDEEPSDSSETTQPEEEDPLSNTILIKSVDDIGTEVSGGTYELWGEEGTTLQTINKDTGYVLDDLSIYGVDGDVTLTLVQTKSPAGYNLAQESYLIHITQSGKVTLEKSTGSRGAIDLGPNKEQIAKFTNCAKDAKIKLTCVDVDVNVDPTCWDYQATIKNFEGKSHEFVLNWKDPNGKWQQESMTLAKGQSGEFKTELPIGTEYEVKPANPDGFSWFITEEYNRKGIISAGQVGKTVDLKATVIYDIERGVGWVDVYMRKVRAHNKTPLSDAKFVLRDAYDDQIKVYLTREDGHIDIEGVFTEPGTTYSLKELKAPEGYAKLNRPIEISIGIGYKRTIEGGKVVMEQVLQENIDSKDVEKTSDGTYIIKNKRLSDIPQTRDPILIWMIVMVISAGAVLVLITYSRKKWSR